jgi:hypothetical protein
MIINIRVISIFSIFFSLLDSVKQLRQQLHLQFIIFLQILGLAIILYRIASKMWQFGTAIFSKQERGSCQFFEVRKVDHKNYIFWCLCREEFIPHKNNIHLTSRFYAKQVRCKQTPNVNINLIWIVGVIVKLICSVGFIRVDQVSHHFVVIVYIYLGDFLSEDDCSLRCNGYTCLSKS